MQPQMMMTNAPVSHAESRDGLSRSSTRKRGWTGITVWLAGCAAALSGGCGYSNEPLHRASVQTIYVEMFESREFRRGIEFQLTEAVRKAIDTQTQYKNVPREKADTILSGEVLEWREATIGRSFATDLPRETAATLAIRYRWQDMRTGKLLVDQPRLITTVQYVPPVGETVHNARNEAVDRLARRIVAGMERPW